MNGKVSIVMPAYNEEEAIGRVLDELFALSLGDMEVIVVDDGSHDGTGEAARHRGAKVVRHPYNRGNGAAVRSGIRAATGDVIVIMDADGQHDPADIPRLLEKMDSYDMVVGARPANAGVWHRNLANRIYNGFASYIVGFPIKDLTSGLRAVRAPLAKSMCYLLPNTFSAPTTMTLAVARGGYGIAYVPIQIRRRAGGKSKISLLRDGFRFFVLMAKVATLFSPLKVFGPLSILVGGPGFFYAIYRLAIGKAWTIPITISLTMGALILVLGLISEQIATLRFQQME
ncbi:MAG: glycosyltransferase family 2 protein [Anaerolineae bacterium]